MGSGAWDPGVYSSSTAKKVADPVTSGYAYSHTTKTTTPSSTWKVHETLDPAMLNSFGKRVRESLDSDEHPTSLAIAVVFDETGSMGSVPRELVQPERLPALYGLLLRKGYVEHPHILFAAVGDAYSDRVPLQVGQFEADNRAEEQLLNVLLEGNGGGQYKESYELAAWFFANLVEMDCLNKRGEKGYLFFIGDEGLYDKVSAKQVRDIIGETLQENPTTEDVFAALKEKFHVYCIRPSGVGASYPRTSSPGTEIVAQWEGLLAPQDVIELDDLDAVAEVIALRIGMEEGTVDLEGGLDDLKSIGASTSTIKSAEKALAKVGGGTGGAIVDTDAPADLADTGGTDRL